jgi:hypothetical protein
MADELEAGLESDVLTAEESAILESGGERDIPEPAAVVEKAPAQDKEAQAAVEGAPKVKTVPHETFHAEREEHKKTKAELAELREFKAAMDERMRWFEAAQQQPAKDDTPPDPNVDVFAALKWTQDKLLDSRNRQTRPASSRNSAKTSSARNSRSGPTGSRTRRTTPRRTPTSAMPPMALRIPRQAAFGAFGG